MVATRIKRSVVVLVLWLAVAGAWKALHHRHENGQRRAVEGWIDSLATGDAGEFCATTTASMQLSNLGRGPCLKLAPGMLRKIQPAWAPFKGARATRSTGGGVATADIVLSDGTHMSEWTFGGVAHAQHVIHVVRVGGTWRVDG
jgi:hypothetical protein